MTNDYPRKYAIQFNPYANEGKGACDGTGEFYAFSDNFSRVTDGQNGLWLFTNAKSDVTDDDIRRYIDSTTMPPWSYQTVKKNELEKWLLSAKK